MPDPTPENPPPEPRRTSIGDVARRLGVSESTARRFADEGRLDVERLATGERIVTLESVDRLARERGGRT